MSVSGSAPMTRARRVRPSDSLTMMRSARSMTWWFVRMLPSASMMKPLPAPRRGSVAARSSGRRTARAPPLARAAGASRVAAGAVASMLTTAGLMRSTTSAKLTRGPARSARRRPQRRSRRAPDGRGGPVRDHGRSAEPAGDDRADEKRDDGGQRHGDEGEPARHQLDLIIRARNAGLIQRFHAELPRLLELAPGVRARRRRPSSSC